MSYDNARAEWLTWTTKQRRQWLATQSLDEMAAGYGYVADGNMPAAAARFAAASILHLALVKNDPTIPETLVQK